MSEDESKRRNKGRPVILLLSLSLFTIFILLLSFTTWLAIDTLLSNGNLGALLLPIMVVLPGLVFLYVPAQLFLQEYKYGIVVRPYDE